MICISLLILFTVTHVDLSTTNLSPFAYGNDDHDEPDDNLVTDEYHGVCIYDDIDVIHYQTLGV